MYQREFYNWKVSDLVSQCHKDIVGIFKEHGIEKIYFSQHEDVLQESVPMVTFSNDKDELSCQELGELTYCEGTKDLLYISADCKFSGYTDGYYGDYFDVAQSLPKIYAAICDIINANDLKPNELV